MIADRDALIDCLSRDGYVALPGFLEGDELSELLENVERFIQEIVPQIAREDAFYEDRADTRTLKQIQKMDQHDSWFGGLFSQGRFRELAELCLGGAVVPRNLQYFNKPPGVGRPTPAHQDGYYFMLDPCEAVTMWLALDHVDDENGCVRYVPGSHLNGMRDHARTQTLGFSQGIVDYPTADDESAEVAITAEPGDLLVHHAMTVHRANGNTSRTRTRRALGLVYYSERAREDSERHAEYQKQLKEDMTAQGKI